MFTNLSRAGVAFGENMGLQAIESEQAKVLLQMEQSYKELDQIEKADVDATGLAREASVARRKLYDKMAKTRAEAISLEREEKSLLLEISDSELFISHLEELLIEFDSAAVAFNGLGSVRFENCPSCFAPITSDDPACCHLCGNEVSESDKKAKALQLRMDFEGQIKESLALQSTRTADLSTLQKVLKRERLLYTTLSRQLNEFSYAPVDGRSALISQKSRFLGALESRLAELDKLTNVGKDIAKLSADKKRLDNELTTLDEEIASLENAQRKRRTAVLTSIVENAKFFLRKDMEEHSDFKKINSFSFSFEDDWFAVNDDPNIAENASGMVMLKNCLMLGILKNSLDDPKMLFPKFIIQDNGEDKGMVGVRVRHFQKTIAEWSEEQTGEHQIILTTSTINEDLDNDERYVRGPKYTAENKTLAIK